MSWLKPRPTKPSNTFFGFFSVFSVPSVVNAFQDLTLRPRRPQRAQREDHTGYESRTCLPTGRSRITDFMGRTVPTFRQLIDDAIARWSKFRRALRREDQEYFDRLFRRVRSYTQAATYQASDNPMEAILLSIALDQEKRLNALERAAPRQIEAALPPITGAGSTLALDASGEAWSPPETGADSTRRRHSAGF